MPDLAKPDTTQTVIYEDVPGDTAIDTDDRRWRILVSKNDEPIVDPLKPPPRTVWETQYYNLGQWHAGTPSWSEWLRLVAKIHQAGLVVGRRAGIDETKEKVTKRDQRIAKFIATIRDLARNLESDDPSDIDNVLPDAITEACDGIDELLNPPKDCTVTPDPVRRRPLAKRLRELAIVLDSNGIVHKGEAARIAYEAAELLDPQPQDCTVTPDPVRLGCRRQALGPGK